MSRFKIKFELNPGGEGVRLDKLANISGELEKFLRNLGKDCGVSTEAGEWIARKFYNSSVGATVEHVGSVDPAAVAKFNAGIRKFTRFNPDVDVFNGQYSENTIRQFVEIGTKLDNDEVVRIGIVDDETNNAGVEWQQIIKRTTVDVEEATLKPIFYIGSVQGRLGTWYKETDVVNVRDSVFGVLVKCNYKPSMYDMIHKCYRDKRAVVHVTGRIKSERLSGVPKEIWADQIDRYDRLSDQEFFSIFGSAPKLIGADSSDNYLDRLRDDGDA